MKRPVHVLSPLALVAAACVTVPAGPVTEPPPAPPPVVHVVPAPPPPRVEAWYGGQHFVPDAYGGGWCYEGRPHRHDFHPDRPEVYVLEGGHYHYRGPLAFTYYEGHPAPGGGWCYARGPHVHEFLPPAGNDWRWQRDRGYVYQGAWRPRRPPPSGYWPRLSPYREAIPAAAPAPSRPVPSPAPYTTRPAPAPAPDRAWPTRPVPPPAPAPPARVAPAPPPRLEDRDRGRHEAAPGHGNLPPGHGGTPPGQTVPAPSGRHADRAGPGRSEHAPGHGQVPPGQGGVPPGQRRKATAAPAAGAAPASSAPVTPATGAPAEAAPTRPTAPAPAKTAPTRVRRPRTDEDQESRSTRTDEEGRAAPREAPIRY